MIAVQRLDDSAGPCFCGAVVFVIRSRCFLHRNVLNPYHNAVNLRICISFCYVYRSILVARKTTILFAELQLNVDSIGR